MKLKTLLSLLIPMLPALSYGQLTNPALDTLSRPGIHFKLEAGGFGGSGNRMPFWFRANQFGTVPLESPAGLVTAAASGLWGNPDNPRRVYVKAGVEVTGNISRNSRVVLPQAYAAIRLGHGELSIGRRKEINGITDTLMSTGSYAWSGNAVPITQIRLGTRDYAPLKFTHDLIAVNAFFSHGWFANSDSMQNVFLHAKALYVRIGKPNWKVRFYGGMSHYAQWGGYSAYLGKIYADNGHLPSSWDAFVKALWPSKVDGNSSGKFTTFDTLNRSGNHLGSIDVALEVLMKKSNLLFYIQHPWEDMSGVVMGNLPDGLYGVRWQNRAPSGSAFALRQVTAEFLTTLNQSGALPPKGADDYFVNYQYLDGWTHEKRVIGTPFFTRWMDADPRWAKLKGGFKSPVMINNNRVQVIHIGLLGAFRSGATVKMLLSQSWNYGRPMRPYPVIVTHQFSGLVEATIPVRKVPGLQFSPGFALDSGDWLVPAAAGMLRVRKLF